MDQGVPYYFDESTGRSIWASPTDWLTNYDPSGRCFFMNRITNESVWADECVPHHITGSGSGNAAANGLAVESMRLPRIKTTTLSPTDENSGGGRWGGRAGGGLTGGFYSPYTANNSSGSGAHQ